MDRQRERLRTRETGMINTVNVTQVRTQRRKEERFMILKPSEDENRIQINQQCAVLIESANALQSVQLSTRVLTLLSSTLVISKQSKDGHWMSR